jgi:hypothetical protein
MKFNVTRFGLVLGVAAAVAFSGPARADVKKCQVGLEKAAAKWQSGLLSALGKCQDAMRKDITKAAKTCEKGLAGAYGKNVDKFRAGAEKAACTGVELSSLGFLLSGPGGNPAPPQGGTPIKFTEDYLLVKAENDSCNMELASAPLFSNLLMQAKDVAKCSGAGAATYPKFCGFKCACSERVCVLGDSVTSTSETTLISYALGSVGVPLTIGPDPLTVSSVLGMCEPGPDLALESGVVYIIAQQARTLGVIDFTDNVSGLYVCSDTLRSSGFCDCSAGGAGLKDITDCMDRTIPSSCTGSSNDACGSPCSAKLADPNYPGTFNGLPNISATGATVPGDCVNMLTNQFTVLTGPGTGGPATYGADGVPCTADDVGGLNSPTNVVLTTGVPTAKLFNYVDKTYGVCTDSSKCVNVCGDGSACVGTNFVVGPAQKVGVSGKRPAAGSYPVATSVCGQYQQNHLKGLSLSGAFPGAALGQGGGLGDDLSSFHLDCQ